MDFTFTEEQLMLKDMLRKFVANEIKPIAAKIDKDAKIPDELIKKLASMGLMGLPFPDKYGGAGYGEVGYCIMAEEIARGCGATATFLGAHISIGSMAIYLDGTEEQKQKYLVPLAKGEKIGAFALTEPNAGSDAAAIETTAVRDGNDFIINGSKIWITNGGIADIITVFAVTDKALGAKGGVTAFIVEKGFKGYSVGKTDEKMGIKGSVTSELIFQDMRVPKENVLGQFGAGFLTAMKALDRGRLGLAACCVGAAKELLDMSTKHANSRVQFGSPLSEKEAIQWMLADMAAEIYAMESITYRTAWMCDNNMKFTRESAIAKMFCSESVGDVVDKALQIHGGLGYMAEYPIERFYRDARIMRIFEGTNEIQRMVIARDVIKKGGY